MITGKIKIDFKIGIHSRPAALIVKKVREFPKCRINFENDGKSGRADSLISLLKLGITEGSEITVSADGENEETALAEVTELILNQVAREA